MCIRDSPETIYLGGVERFPRRVAGLNVEDAAAEISLDAFRDWLDAERIIMNVNALYKEYSDEAPVFDRIELFAMMARYRKRVGID